MNPSEVTERCIGLDKEILFSYSRMESPSQDKEGLFGQAQLEDASTICGFASVRLLDKILKRSGVSEEQMDDMTLIVIKKLPGE
jgi:hypothetical protein